MAYSINSSDNFFFLFPQTVITAQMLSLMEGQRPDHKNEKHQFTVPAVLHIAQTRSFRSFPGERAGNRVDVAAHE